VDIGNVLLHSLSVLVTKDISGNETSENTDQDQFFPNLICDPKTDLYFQMFHFPKWLL